MTGRRSRPLAPLVVALAAAFALVASPALLSAQETGVVGTAEHETHGTILVTSDGMALYTTTLTEAEVDLDAWQPLTVDSEDEDLVIDANVLVDISTTVRADTGGIQVTANGEALYTFAGDVEPGDVNGHGEADAWFVAEAEVEVEVGGEFSVTPTPGGVTITLYTGSLTELEADGAAHGLSTAFATVDGEFVGYVFGAPDFVNADFTAHFATGLEAQGLIVRAS